MKLICSLLSLFLGLSVLSGCTGTPSPSSVETNPTQQHTSIKTREGSIPAGAVKLTPETDISPPILHSTDYYEPVPLGPVINTAGGEDSPFVTGDAFYFFFTPDINVPPEQQILDGVTGIYVAYKKDNQWQTPQRVVLQDEDKLALDGAECVLDSKMWFASIRDGNYRMIDMWTAEFKDGRWMNWNNAGEKLNVEYEIGECHLSADGSELYFHSSRAGGKGDFDIWVTKKVNGEWQKPVNIAAVNSSGKEGWPCVTADGDELWFTRTYLGTPAIFVSHKTNGQWGEPELVISQFAGEPALDTAGNIYFVHHYYLNGKMAEADIYVAYHK